MFFVAISEIINNGLKAFSEFSNAYKISKEKQAESEIIKEKKELKKASNICEDIIDISKRIICIQDYYIGWLLSKLYLNKDDKRISKNFADRINKNKKTQDKLIKEFNKLD